MNWSRQILKLTPTRGFVNGYFYHRHSTGRSQYVIPIKICHSCTWGVFKKKTCCVIPRQRLLPQEMKGVKTRTFFDYSVTLLRIDCRNFSQRTVGLTASRSLVHIWRIYCMSDCRFHFLFPQTVCTVRVSGMKVSIFYMEQHNGAVTTPALYSDGPGFDSQSRGTLFWQAVSHCSHSPREITV